MRYWRAASGSRSEPEAMGASEEAATQGVVTESEPRGRGSSKFTSKDRAVACFLMRCRKLAENSQSPSDASAKSLKRARTSLKLGRPCKAPSMRENLFEWFCSIRGSIKGRIPLSALRFKAEYIRQQYIEVAAKLLRKADVP